MSQYLASFAQSVTIGSTVFNVTNSSWTEANDNQEVSGSLTSGANGKKYYVPGLSSVTGSFDLVYDLSSPPNIAAGATVSVSNILGSSGTQGLTCSTCIVQSRAYALPIAGTGMVTISFSTSGPYTISIT